MATLAQVRDGITHLGGQLASGTALSAELVGSILAQLVIVVDVLLRVEQDQSRLTTQVAMEVGSIKDKATQQQGMLDLMYNNGGQKRDTSHQPRGI